MLATFKNITIGLLLLLAIGLSSWSILLSNASQSAVAPTDPKEPDSFMQDVTVITLNQEGKQTLQLTTPQMIHYPENNTTDITTPHVTIFRNSPKPWYIDSDYARTTNGISEILFWSNVNIHHPADEVNPTTTLRTKSLSIFPEQQIAKTDQPVIFVQPDTTVHAVGMLANLDAGTIKLLAKAKGEYVPIS